MESIDFNKLTDDQKELIFKIGLIKLSEITFDGLIPIEKMKKNISFVREMTGLEEDDIWKCYEFASQAAFSLGKPKVRESIGFKK